MLQLIIRVLSLTLALLLVLKPLISVAANQEVPKAVQTQSSTETAAQKNPSAADQSTGTESPEDTRRRELTAKYGAEIAEAILAGTVVSGMTMEQVLLVRGDPTHKEVIPPDMELWHYPTSEVAFQNGKVSYVARNPEPQPTPQPSSKEAIYFDDFSSYTPGFPPTGWLLRGADQVTPTVQEIGGIGPSYRLVDFPEVPWQYWDR
jgi:hypothetical protein